MWAHEHFDVQPDLLAFGKKAQVCGMMGGGWLDRESPFRPNAPTCCRMRAAGASCARSTSPTARRAMPPPITHSSSA
jgi:4-aminobutyrate aminotransferase-like enzyme